MDEMDKNGLYGRNGQQMSFFVHVVHKVHFCPLVLCLLAFLYIPLSCFGNLASDTLYLTWQRDPTTTMTIQWISEVEDKNNSIAYHEKGATEWNYAIGCIVPLPLAPKLVFHRIELTQLKPYTDYTLKFGEAEYLFRTMPSTLSTPVRFVEGGDMYQNDMTAVIKTSLQAAKTNPDFALIGGDIAYAVGKIPIQKIQRWIDWVIMWHKTMVTPENRMIPVIAAIGNHDLIGQYGQNPAQAKVFSLLFPMPGPQIYNVLDFGNYLSLILLDSGHATPIAGRQSEWLKSALEGRRDVTHRFAVYHVPAYSSIRKFENSKSRVIQRHWVPIFDKEYLDLAFEHNDHAYKRTYPLRSNKVDPTGVIYIGDGAWGVEPRTPRIKKKPFYIAKFAATRHFLLLNLKCDGYQIQSIDSNGHIIDQVSRRQVVKQG